MAKSSCCAAILVLASAAAIFADDSAPAPPTSPTFSKNVAAIFQRHCQECHRPGQIAPMSLLSFDDARPWAKSIRKAVADRTMPPWQAAPGVRAYANDRSLSDAEIKTIIDWAESGAPQGDPAEAPAPRQFHEGWILGEPDLAIAMDAPYNIAPTGEDEYRCFVLDPKLTETKWASAVEILAGNPLIDHHIVLYVDQKGVSTKEDERDPAPGYECFGGPGFQANMLGGWGPGLAPKQYPPGTGHPIEAGAKIVMQMHYHRSGKAETDQTRVGIHFADAPVERKMRDGIVLNFDLNIPAGDANHQVAAEKPIYKNITVYSAIPHMHLLGKSMKIWAELPDGSQIPFVDVPRWDFNWQTEYIFAEPVKIPKGSTVKLLAAFDNSADNPNQPTKPPRRVGFGESTTDEMCVGVFNYTVDSERLN